MHDWLVLPISGYLELLLCERTYFKPFLLIVNSAPAIYEIKVDLPLPVAPRTKLHSFMFLKEVSLVLTVFMSWDSFWRLAESS